MFNPAASVDMKSSTSYSDTRAIKAQLAIEIPTV